MERIYGHRVLGVLLSKLCPQGSSSQGGSLIKCRKGVGMRQEGLPEERGVDFDESGRQRGKGEAI